MRLSAETASQLPGSVARPSYDRSEQKAGVVHFGIGAFHRAHQAWYTDRAMDAGDRDWGIIGVSLRSGDVAEQMNPQDGLFTLTERSETGDETRLIGSVREVLHASTNLQRLASSLVAPTTHIVSLTITEKGYCRAADGSLDPELTDENSFYAILADAFATRRAAGTAGLTLLSCDNLANNGEQLHRLMGEYLDSHDPSLRAWFEAECACPSTMVDRIVPATTDSDRHALETRLGMRDEAAVFTEPFSQWVIEDRFAGQRPRWENVGAQFVADVASYEKMKLRMLNGAHSALAYLGLARGHDYVHQAIRDVGLRALVGRLMFDEAMPTLDQPEAELHAYGRALLARFDNPALPHRLIQIAMDGSQKIPQRWLETLAVRQARGLPSPALLEALSAWLIHIRGGARPVDDPMAVQLSALWKMHGREGVANALFNDGGPLSGVWRPTEADIAALSAHLSA